LQSADRSALQPHRRLFRRYACDLRLQIKLRD
jgi:hypothetical protein